MAEPCCACAFGRRARALPACRVFVVVVVNRDLASMSSLILIDRYCSIVGAAYLAQRDERIDRIAARRLFTYRRTNA
jgi:hypothetical protein